MKFNEKLSTLRKKQGLSQEELGMELQVSRQTISKWESGQSYPDFQKLVLLSDYFAMTLDELVRDIDVQDVRERDLNGEKLTSVFNDIEKGKSFLHQVMLYAGYCGLILIALILIAFILKLIFPQTEWLLRQN